MTSRERKTQAQRILRGKELEEINKRNEILRRTAEFYRLITKVKR